MRLASLGSGSRGNATLVESANASVLVDCGFSVRELQRRMAGRDRHPEQLTAILVTHEHSDHIRGVFALARRFSLPVYMTAGTAKSCVGERWDKVEIINAQRTFRIEDIVVQPVAVPHDAREPVQFVFHCRGKSLGVLTDLGSITAHVIDAYRACDGLLLEANHDRAMLAEGSYPYPLKQRVGGDWGHLNNEQAAGLLTHLELQRLQGLVIGHMSEQNNCLEAVRSHIDPLAGSIALVHYASQDNGAGWLAIE